MNDLLAGLRAGSLLLRGGVAVAIAAAGVLVLAGLKLLVLKRLARVAPLTKTRLDDLLLEVVRRTMAVSLIALPTLLALSVVDLPAPVGRLGRGLAFLVCLVQVGVWGACASRSIVDLRILAASGGVEDPARQPAARMLALAAQVVIWTILFLVALGNFGIDVTTLVAGLGVGGVAVALAVQNILGDVFASVSILLDKPFVPGDFVVVEDLMGTVEQIGIKTTRVRSLGGELLVLSNADLLKSRLRNFKHMSERRVVFRLGVVYQTDPDKLAEIPRILREAVSGQEGVRFDRAHFASYGDFALVFEVAYYVLSPDYNRYMDVQQALNLDIYRRFADAHVEFAFPTQTLYVQPAQLQSPARRPRTVA